MTAAIEAFTKLRSFAVCPPPKGATLFPGSTWRYTARSFARGLHQMLRPSESAIARLAVSPGESFPNWWINAVTP